MTFRGCFPLFSKIRQILSGSELLMGKIKLDETYILKSALKCDSFDVAIGIKIPFFSSLPRLFDKIIGYNLHGLRIAE